MPTKRSTRTQRTSSTPPDQVDTEHTSPLDSICLDMSRKTEQRTSNKQTALDAHYDSQHSQLQLTVQDVIAESMDTVFNMHSDRVEYLKVLIERKTELEEALIRDAQELAIAYEQMRGEMDAVVKWKDADVAEGMKRLSALKDGQEEAEVV